MFRRRAREVPAELADAAESFRATVDAVDSAREILVAAAPGARGLRAPLAEALAAFESGLRDAGERMAGWRVDAVADSWTNCRFSLDETLRRAERLRLEGSPQGYEELAGILADLIEPLDAFAEAEQRFRDLRAVT